jgi:hypothetical protein
MSKEIFNVEYKIINKQIMNRGFFGMWSEAVLAYFSVLSNNMPIGADSNENPSSK